MLKNIVIVTFLHFFLTIGTYAGSTMGFGDSEVQLAMSKYAVEMMQVSRYLSQPAFDLVLNMMSNTSPLVGLVLMINSLFWGILLVCLTRLLWLMWS